MSDTFVWFQNNSRVPDAIAPFYERLLGWRRADAPPGMTMFAGEKGPFAAVAPGAGTWVPFARVDDVDAAARRAIDLGATVLQEKTRGPAGQFVIVADPGGAAIALWQQA